MCSSFLRALKDGDGFVAVGRGYIDCGALHLGWRRWGVATNIAVRCTLDLWRWGVAYKDYGALHLGWVAMRCDYKYYGALHLGMIGFACPTKISVRCTLGC
ncbi:MAG: hypothetical protein IT258_23280 [Saprospiraceae bacterium]|nr:hypothetical protein [Saprospiraceae bacterium]